MGNENFHEVTGMNCLSMEADLISEFENRKVHTSFELSVSSIQSMVSPSLHLHITLTVIFQQTTTLLIIYATTCVSPKKKDPSFNKNLSEKKGKKN